MSVTLVKLDSLIELLSRAFNLREFELSGVLGAKGEMLHSAKPAVSSLSSEAGVPHTADRLVDSIAQDVSVPDTSVQIRNALVEVLIHLGEIASQETVDLAQQVFESWLRSQACTVLAVDEEAEQVSQSQTRRSADDHSGSPVPLQAFSSKLVEAAILARMASVLSKRSRVSDLARIIRHVIRSSFGELTAAPNTDTAISTPVAGLVLSESTIQSSGHSRGADPPKAAVPTPVRLLVTTESASPTQIAATAQSAQSTASTRTEPLAQAADRPTDQVPPVPEAGINPNAVQDSSTPVNTVLSHTTESEPVLRHTPQINSTQREPSQPEITPVLKLVDLLADARAAFSMMHVQNPTSEAANPYPDQEVAGNGSETATNTRRHVHESHGTANDRPNIDGQSPVVQGLQSESPAKKLINLCTGATVPQYVEVVIQTKAGDRPIAIVLHRDSSNASETRQTPIRIHLSMHTENLGLVSADLTYHDGISCSFGANRSSTDLIRGALPLLQRQLTEAGLKVLHLSCHESTVAQLASAGVASPANVPANVPNRGKAPPWPQLIDTKA